MQSGFKVHAPNYSVMLPVENTKSPMEKENLSDPRDDAMWECP